MLFLIFCKGSQFRKKQTRLQFKRWMYTICINVSFLRSCSDFRKVYYERPVWSEEDRNLVLRARSCLTYHRRPRHFRPCSVEQGHTCSRREYTVHSGIETAPRYSSLVLKTLIMHWKMLLAFITLYGLLI